ncbi:hypothetical protein ACGFMK_27930, partial [Amycolatopsis sp. NPDC049252]
AERDGRRVAIVAVTRPVLRVLRLFAEDVRIPTHSRMADAVREPPGYSARLSGDFPETGAP